MEACKFSSTAAETKPDNVTTTLLEKAMSRQPLSRTEKDRIAEILYGTFGSHASTYKLTGWAWDMADCLPRILVNFTYDRYFLPFYAPDKTSLRKALSHQPIREMIYA